MKALGIAISSSPTAGFCQSLPEGLHHSSNTRRNVLKKLAFDQTNFVSGYVLLTMGGFMGALGLLIRPSWRRQIFWKKERSAPQNWFWYFVNRFLNRLGSFHVFYAISLTATGPRGRHHRVALRHYFCRLLCGYRAAAQVAT